MTKRTASAWRCSTIFDNFRFCAKSSARRGHRQRFRECPAAEARLGLRRRVRVPVMMTTILAFLPSLPIRTMKCTQSAEVRSSLLSVAGKFPSRKLRCSVDAATMIPSHFAATRESRSIALKKRPRAMRRYAVPILPVFNGLPVLCTLFVGCRKCRTRSSAHGLDVLTKVIPAGQV